MRKLYFFLPVLLCLWLPGRAQIVEDSISLDAMLDRAFSELNLSYVSSGILMDKVPRYVDHTSLKGYLPPDSIFLPGFAFPLLYGMIDRAHTGTSSLQDIEEWWETFKQHQSNDTLKLGLLWYVYDKLREDAIDENLLSFSVDRFYDVPARRDHPYIKDTLFATAVMRTQITGAGQLIHYDTTLFFSNLAGSAPALQVDAGDGLGWRSISPGGFLNVTFPQDTFHLIKVRLLSTLGRDWYGNTAVTQDGVGSFHEGEGNSREFSASPDTVISVTGATLSVFRNMNCSDSIMLRKPLILVEGFDPNNSHDWTFITSEEIPGLLDLFYGDPEFRLKDYIHGGGYDIVFVNLINGSDTIQANAQVVKEAIRRINEIKAANGSSEKNVVIGASMGGVVSKWALKEMEIDKEDHETEMFISFDSPMRGANIPMGMQAFVRDMNTVTLFGFLNPSDLKPVAEEGWNTINSPAAKQMLYYNIAGCGDFLNCDLSNLSAMHGDFYSEFIALGNLAIPEYAISNGAIDASFSEEFDAGDHLLADDLTINEWWNIGGPGLSLLSMEVFLWALPGGGSDKVYHRNMFHVVLGIPFYAYAYCKVVNGTPFNYDNAPGGIREFSSGTSENWLHSSFCFIPTISSLSLNVTDPFHIGFNLENPANILQNNTSIDSYIGSRFSSVQNGVTRVNQDHVSLDSFTAPYLRSLILKLDENIGTAGELSSTYNFGKANSTIHSLFPGFAQTPNIIDEDIDVLDGGKLWINRFGKIGDTSNSGNPDNQIETAFTVTLGKNTCTGEGVIVSIKDGGELVLGDVGDSEKNKGFLIIKDEGILEVDGGGEVTLKDESNITIAKDGRIEILENGLLNTVFGSSLTILADGEIIVKSGGILRLSHYSYLTILPGGKLTFEDGAILQLWDAPAVDGEARIIVKGELNPEGEILFDGNGFFDFYPGHTLNISNGTFTIEGDGKESRLIRLSESATLNLGDNIVEISEARIVFDHTAQIASNGASLKFTEVHFEGDERKSMGIQALDPARLQLDGCTIDGHDIGLEVYGASGAAITQGLSITETNLRNNQVGITLNSVPLTVINQSEFEEAAGIGNVGLQIYECPQVQVRNSNFQDISHAGISVFYAKNLLLFNTSISDCHFGIWDENTAQTGYSSNIYMLDGAEISNCDTGIHLIGGIYEGLVYMDCAKLWNNGVGIEGEDITLAIDAKVHALATDGTIRPNSFKYASGGSYFQICYFQKWYDIGSTIPASNNYWYDEPSINYPLEDYFIRKSAWPDTQACNFTGNRVNLLYTPEVTTEPTVCIARMVTKHDPERTVPSGFTDVDCQQEVYLDTTKVVGGYSAGISSFYLEDFDDAEAYLGQVAASAIDTTSAICSEYIRISRSMSPPALLERPASTFEHEISSYSVKNDEFTVNPIPFDDWLNISSKNLKGMAQIFDLTGSMKHSIQFTGGENSLQIATREWSPGIYFVKIITPAGEIITRKILKNK